MKPNPEELAETLALARELIQIDSVSPSIGESKVASTLARFLKRNGLEILDGAHSVLPDGRRNLYASIGNGPRTVVLSGHMDTVGVADYARFGSPDLAFRPTELGVKLEADFGKGWLFGRGSLDMKGSLAMIAGLLARLARRRDPLLEQLRIVFVAVCDEENASAGIRAASRFLAKLQKEEGAQILGFVNTDYTSPLHPGDERRCFYRGSIGKLLPSILIHGKGTHAGEPCSGLNPDLMAAEILSDLDMNLEFCEKRESELTPPPTTLRLRDLKEHYDVQTPLEAQLYLNFFTFERGPEEVVELVRCSAQKSLDRLGERLAKTRRDWYTSIGADEWDLPQDTRMEAIRFSQLADELRAGGEDPERLAAEVARELSHAEGGQTAGGGSASSPRTIAREVVRLCLARSGRADNPCAVVYLSPPFYPAVHSHEDAPLIQALQALVDERQAELPNLDLLSYYPYISDASLVSLTNGVREDYAELQTEMPSFGRSERRELDAIGKLDFPVINMGPSGFGAHKETERVEIAYSFETLPDLIEDLVHRLAVAPSENEPAGMS